MNTSAYTRAFRQLKHHVHDLEPKHVVKQGQEWLDQGRAHLEDLAHLLVPAKQSGFGLFRKRSRLNRFLRRRHLDNPMWVLAGAVGVAVLFFVWKKCRCKAKASMQCCGCQCCHCNCCDNRDAHCQAKTKQE
ncbi:MAG: hypothetical protein U0Z75_04910 [Deinococcaceae bacterium]